MSHYLKFCSSACVILLCILAVPSFAAVDLSHKDEPSFPLVTNGHAASVMLPNGAPDVVKIAAGDFADDVAVVSGAKPLVIEGEEGGAEFKGPLIELVLAPDLAGQWEAFRLSATGNRLTVAASDARGLAYGVYELSRRIGVSPWYWWADVPVAKHPEIRLTIGAEPVDKPAVKYRGIFINDEDWGLEPWASQTFDRETGNIGPKTYAKMFGLLLRLRANLIWPAMHPTTTPFFLVPGNAEVADKYDIIVGSSHAEPMLLNNGREWKDDAKKFNYLTNREGVLAYWEARVKQRTAGESMFTIGMRGINDSPIIGPKGQAQRISTLEKVFADQRTLLAKYVGHGDATRVPQLFCPYKEVLDDYEAGLKVPDDVTIVWPDDNYGYIRRFPTSAERERAGGLGVYYHASYSGMPMSWLWCDTLPPALPWSEMTRAYEQGSKALWIVNVGDIKNTERSAEFFLNLAWHADRTDVNAPAKFIHDAAARDFGPEHADAIADVLKQMQAINFDRKNEHLQWFLSKTAYKPTQLNEAEIAERLKACEQLLRDSDAIAARLPADAQDAYFELVGFPVEITEAANERYFRAELARADVARNRDPAANLAAAQAAESRAINANAYYNEKVAGGKWRGIVTVNGVSPKDWPRFQRDTKTERPKPDEDNVVPPSPPAPSPLLKPAGAKTGDFVERDGVVSIDAGHFTSETSTPAGAGWRMVPGLGRTGTAVTVMPSTADLSGTKPTLTYRLYTVTEKPATLRVRLLPTFPIVADHGLRFAVSIDDAPPLPMAVTDGFDAGKPGWYDRVLSNSTEATLTLSSPLKPGLHTLKLVAADAGVVVDKIVFDLGGLRPSYDGPAETRLP